MHYTEDLLHAANRLKFPGIIEREFRETHYNVKAHLFISRWGLIPAICILCAFWAGDFVGFTRHLEFISIIRVVSILPLVVMYATRNTNFMRSYIRDVACVYLFLLACSVLTIISITPDTDFAHRGYTLSFPMVIFIIFLAKPRLWLGSLLTLLFTLLLTTVDIIYDIRPIGLHHIGSQIHVNLVMVSSVVIGAVTCYVLEVAERREFIQKRIIEQDKEQILLQQLELADVVKQIQQANQKLSEQNEHLDQLDKEKNEFLGIAAHDLKNPLTGIAVNVANVKRYIHRMQTSDVISTMDSIEKTVVRMRDIVVHLLDINAIESGKMDVTIQPCNVSTVVTTILRDYSNRAAAKSITLTTEDTTNKTLACLADSTILYQVLDNLVSNAIKFSPSGKTVTIRTRYSSVNGGSVMHVEVQDEGPGLTADDMKKLFNKYQRLSAKPTAGEHSTGLGLSIVKKMVESMNGKVWCSSQVGHGALFTLELPATSVQEEHNEFGKPDFMLSQTAPLVSGNNTVAMQSSTVPQ